MSEIRISFAQIRMIVDHLHRSGYHIVPATKDTANVAMRADRVEELFQLSPPMMPVLSQPDEP